MSITRFTEIKSASTVSFQDAIEKGIARACKTLDNVKSAWIANQELEVDEHGKICLYLVQMKITFIIEN